MRTLLSLLFAASLSLTPALAAPAKDFTLQSIDNEKISLSDYKDDVVVISFWATWCGPCKEEMPHLQKMYDAKKDKGFTVISISTDDARSASRVKPFIKKNGYTFPVLLDRESKVITSLNPTKTLPFTVVVAKGEVVKSISGFNPGDEETLEKLVDELLAKGAPAPEAPPG